MRSLNLPASDLGAITFTSPGCRTIRRLLVGVIGVAWLALGFLSDNVPWFGETFWIVACGAAAGSAFSLAHWTTFHALKRYGLIAGIVGTLRSAAYATNGAWGPLWVWIILLATTFAAILALMAQRTHPR